MSIADNSGTVPRTLLEKFCEHAWEVHKEREIMEHVCDNCGAEYTDETLHEVIGNLAARVEPGGVVPSGECTSCGALCYPKTKETHMNSKKMIIIAAIREIERKSGDVTDFICRDVCELLEIPQDSEEAGEVLRVYQKYNNA